MKHRKPYKFFILHFAKYALIGISSFSLYLGYEQLMGNFHEVVEGEVYRSGELSEKRIAHDVEKYKIASIVNLRGPNPDKAWYREEMTASSKHHIAHFDFSMSSKRELTRKQAIELVRIIKAAPKPVLIHCQGGSDRSGLAASLYLAAHHPTLNADAQLSAAYGYFPYRHIGAPAMRNTYNKFKDTVARQANLANQKRQEPFKTATNDIKLIKEGATD